MSQEIWKMWHFHMDGNFIVIVCSPNYCNIVTLLLNAFSFFIHAWGLHLCTSLLTCARVWKVFGRRNCGNILSNAKSSWGEWLPLLAHSFLHVLLIPPQLITDLSTRHCDQHFWSWEWKYSTEWKYSCLLHTNNMITKLNETTFLQNHTSYCHWL